ncbi:MAG: hypothetical protein EXR73_00030 [Myxococcales bacterium]|nr:hypothetical protein [Myxococcales bacterium]
MRSSLADIVVAAELADSDRVAQAERRSRRTGEPLVVTLIDVEHIDELLLVAALARHLKLPVLPSDTPVDPDALAEVPLETARRLRIVPLSFLEDPAGVRVLRLAMADPTDRDAVAELEMSTGAQLAPALMLLSAVEAAVTRVYRGVATAVMPTPSRVLPAPAPALFGGALFIATPAMPMLAEFPPRAPVAGAGTAGTGPAMAELELRHRALLELLLEKGLFTPDEYAATLERLRPRGT